MTNTALIEIAPNVWQIPLLGNLINAYLIGDILIDAGIRSSATRLQRVLEHRPLRAHALTHAHADHQGATHAICTQRKLPLWIHGREAQLTARGDLRTNMPRNPITYLQRRYWAGAGQAVERELKSQDDLNGFEVLETPGHSLGHISLWRAADRVLIVGDVMTNVNVLTGQRGLHLPLGVFTLDAERNQTHLRRLAALEPRIALFGHGPPLRDPESLWRFAESHIGAAPFSTAMESQQATSSI